MKQYDFQDLGEFFHGIVQVLNKYPNGNRLAFIKLSLPEVLIPVAVEAMTEAAYQDKNCPNGDPFENFGKWHRAANIVQARITQDRDSRGAEYVPLGDWSWHALMDAVRAER